MPTTIAPEAFASSGTANVASVNRYQTLVIPTRAEVCTPQKAVAKSSERWRYICDIFDKYAPEAFASCGAASLPDVYRTVAMTNAQAPEAYAPTGVTIALATLTLHGKMSRELEACAPSEVRKTKLTTNTCANWGGLPWNRMYPKESPRIQPTKIPYAISDQKCERHVPPHACKRTDLSANPPAAETRLAFATLYQVHGCERKAMA